MTDMTNLTYSTAVDMRKFQDGREEQDALPHALEDEFKHSQSILAQLVSERQLKGPGQLHLVDRAWCVTCIHLAVLCPPTVVSRYSHLP